MNINRHNYEEFFLLYVDNELSAADRNAVELFVRRNPDLEKELQLLQQSVVQDDAIVFEDKNSLLKTDELALLQEKLLLFADDELPFAERTQLEIVLGTDAAGAAEWKILQQTKLQPDTIVFDDKRSLYRTEGGRVIGIKWWRAAAAVLLLGLGIWLGRNVFKTDKPAAGTTNETVANSKDKHPQDIAPVIPAPVESPIKESSGNETVNSTSPKNEQVQPTVEKINPVVKEINNPKNKAQQNSDNIVKQDNNPGNKKPSNNLPKPVLENINNPDRNKNSIVHVELKTPDSKIPLPLDNKNDALVISKEKQNVVIKKEADDNKGAALNPIAKTAAYSETEAERNDTRILYMDEDKVKKTKFGGIFRRLKRVVERTTNIKAGNSVKVAGFEIAIK